MSKFKIGDTIRRTGATLECIAQFDTLTVSCLTHGGDWLGVAEYSSPYGDRTPFLASKFELVQAASEQPAVLTPLEVAEYLLAGTPELEYQYGNNSRWYAVKHPHLLSIQTVQEATFRKKPTTVLINGIPVPAPLNNSEINALERASAYSIDTLNRNTPWVRAIHDKQLLWSTKEEAQEALDAIMTSFSK